LTRVSAGRQQARRHANVWFGKYQLNMEMEKLEGEEHECEPGV
jgi:hypothetical protein